VRGRESDENQFKRKYIDPRQYTLMIAKGLY